MQIHLMIAGCCLFYAKVIIKSVRASLSPTKCYVIVFCKRRMER